MASRAFRRYNPITLLLVLILFLGFLIFLLTPSAPSPSSSIPSPPKEKSKPGARKPPVTYPLNHVKTTSDPLGNRERILVLTPMARFYSGYWDNLLKLKFPRELIELGFIIPKTREGNMALKRLEEAVRVVQTGANTQRFHGITILRQDFDTPTSQNEKDRHALGTQKLRRSAMARARNSLLFTTIGMQTSWVLWLDADIIDTPPTLIQDLASHDRAVITPNCFQRYTEDGKTKIRPYDFNAWHDSEVALQMASKMGNDDVIFEGYKEMATYRKLMAYEMVPKGNIHDEVTLEGVGGTALLVKAEVHRDGAMFPPFAFYNLIETEGFAKMARRLGYRLYGLPNYLVYHYNE
jgi:mannan polymerase complexes MNN9 subunit